MNIGKYRSLKYVIAILLFLLPFSWYSHDNLLLGEDDGGFLYSDPIQTIQTMGGISTWWSAGNIAVYNPLIIYDIPFALFLATIKSLTFGLINLQQFSFGLIISLSFIFIVNILEFFTKQQSMAFFISGLFYSLSPVFFVVEYFYLMPSTFDIALYPIIVYFFLKGYETRNSTYYLIGSIFTFIFARSFFNPAYGIAFFSFFLLFIIIYSRLQNKNFICLLRDVGKYTIYIILINIIIFINIGYSFFLKNNAILNVELEKGAIIDQLIISLHNELQVYKVLDFLLNIFPYGSAAEGGFRMLPIYLQYLNNVKFIGIIIPIVILIALISPHKENKYQKLILLVSIMFLLTFSILTVTVFPFGENIYIYFMREIPYFHIFRHPFLKFNLVFLFYYLITFGLSIYIIYESVKNKYAKVLVFCIPIIILLILTQPFLLGDFVNKPYPPFYFTREVNFNSPEFIEATTYLRNIDDDGNVFWFPMGYGYAMFIPTGENNAYRGHTPLKYFTFKTTIGNVEHFGYVGYPEVQILIRKFYFNFDDDSLLKLAKLLNFKYIIVYKNTEKLRKFTEIIPSLTYDRKDYYNGVVLDKPIFKNNAYEIYKIKNYNNISKFTTLSNSSEILFNKTSDYKYEIAIKTKGTDIIYFNEPFSSGWEFFRISKEKFSCKNPKKLSLNHPNIMECDHNNKNILTLYNSLYLFRYNIDFVSTSNNSFNNSWELNTNNQFEYFELFFSPQKYVDISILLSLIIFIIYICLIAFNFYTDRIKCRQKNLLINQEVGDKFNDL